MKGRKKERETERNGGREEKIYHMTQVSHSWEYIQRKLNQHMKKIPAWPVRRQGIAQLSPLLWVPQDCNQGINPTALSSGNNYRESAPKLVYVAGRVHLIEAARLRTPDSCWLLALFMS